MAGKLLMSSRIMACGQALTHAPHPVHAAEIAASFDQGGQVVPTAPAECRLRNLRRLMLQLSPMAGSF
jgi:hypothetical protein